MKKIIYFAIVALMMLSMASCGCSDRCGQSQTVEESPVYMVWQEVDSTSMHINLNDTACITMTAEDSVLVFKTTGIGDFKVTVDSAEIPCSVSDTDTYRFYTVDLNGKHAVIQADSTELEIDLDM